MRKFTRLMHLLFQGQQLLDQWRRSVLICGLVLHPMPAVFSRRCFYSIWTIKISTSDTLLRDNFGQFGVVCCNYCTVLLNKSEVTLCHRFVFVPGLPANICRTLSRKPRKVGFALRTTIGARVSPGSMSEAGDRCGAHIVER
jgi:hypothetical protein